MSNHSSNPASPSLHPYQPTTGSIVGSPILQAHQYNPASPVYYPASPNPLHSHHRSTSAISLVSIAPPAEAGSTASALDDFLEKLDFAMYGFTISRSDDLDLPSLAISAADRRPMDGDGPWKELMDETRRVNINMLVEEFKDFTEAHGEEFDEGVKKLSKVIWPLAQWYERRMVQTYRTFPSEEEAMREEYAMAEAEADEGVKSVVESVDKLLTLLDTATARIKELKGENEELKKEKEKPKEEN